MPTEILLIGGKGKTGSLVASELVKRGIVPRIGTRKPGSRNEVAFDWHQPDGAAEAFRGVDAVYIVAPTDSSDHGTIAPPVLDKALQAGVKRFVLLSASSLEAGGPMMGQIHAYLRDAVPEWTILRPTWFMQNFSAQQHLATIRDEDAIYTATGDGKIAFIDAADIAQAAVGALLADKPWNRDFILTGPQTLSYSDMATKISHVTGRRIKHFHLTASELIARYVAAGMDEKYASALAMMDEAISKGSEDRVTDGVRTLSGKEPSDADSFVRQQSHVWIKENQT